MNVDMAANIEKNMEYCLANSNFGINIRGNNMKLKLHTCSSCNNNLVILIGLFKDKSNAYR